MVHSCTPGTPAPGRPDTRSGPGWTRRQALGAGVVAGLGSVLAGCGRTEAQLPALSTGPPRRGGTLRVGLTGGGAADSLDAHIPVSTTDIARVVNLYESLLYRDENYELKPLLAASATPSPDARTWTVRLRDGVRFHDGRPLTGGDVAATYRRITDPADPKSAAVNLEALDEVVALDQRTVEFRLNQPSAVFDDALGQYNQGIVPADYDPAAPVGTGPFRYDSFTAGQRSVFARHDGYWGDPQPYLDELEILNFSDTDALINALLSTQVDAVGQIPPALVDVVAADPRIEVLNAETGLWLPFTMRVDRPPFDDVRVRQAFRLAVDRQEMVEQVLSGHGRIANDLYAPYDPGYADELPQRTRDVERARRLLAEAGHPDGIDVELVTAPIQAGAVEAAQVFAQQAAAAGIRVEIRRVDTTTFFGDGYLQWDFAQDFWYTRNFLPQAANGSLPESPYNETHWAHPRFIELVEQARGTVDAARRNALIAEAQRIEHEEGGYIVWGYPNQVDAHQGYVAGLVPSRTGLALSGFEFRRVWLGGGS